MIVDIEKPSMNHTTLRKEKFNLSKSDPPMGSAGVFEIAGEVFVEEVVAAVPEDRNSAYDAEGCRDPDTDCGEYREIG